MLFSCQIDTNPTEIYNDYYSNLALVENNYYYTLKLNDGSVLYATVYGGDVNFYKSTQKVEVNANTITGVGFFISKSGKLITHKDLIKPKIDLLRIKKKLDARDHKTIQGYKNKADDLLVELSKLSGYYIAYEDILTDSQKNDILYKHTAKVDSIELIREEIGDLQDSKNKDFDYKIVNHTINVSRIKGNDFESLLALDFIPLEQTDFTQEKHDLFFLKPKDAKIFGDIKNIDLEDSIGSIIKKNDLVHVFNVKKESGANLKYSPVFLSNINLGNVDQFSLEFKKGVGKFMPGSPVFNSEGNFIGISDTYNEDGLQEVIRKKSLYAKKQNPKNVIISFLIAEDKRDLNTIEKYFASNIERYYDMTYPSFDELKERYEYIWSFTKNSKNEVLNIKKIDDYNFNLTTKFSYLNTRKNKKLSTESTIRFTFDGEGKVTKIYKI